jgi:preprotein translocase subunit SecG
MVASILLQEDKSGGGIGMIGGSAQSFFGASSSSILSKITTILLTVFFVLSIAIAIVSSSFSRQSLISETDIEKTELEIFDTEAGINAITVPPAKVLIVDFDEQFIQKINNTADKDFVLSLYAKDGDYYTIKKKISDKDQKKLLGLLNDVGFTLQAETTVVTPPTEQ